MANNNEKQSLIYLLDRKFEAVTSRPILFLSAIVIIGLIIRLAYFPYEIPIVFDGSGYFWYAIDTSVQGHFPDSDCGWRCMFPNNGWPALLSVFFSLLNFNNFMDYMNLQRLLTISISVLTVIPMYLLCKRFVEKRYALLGAALFVIDPRIALNSLLGITEPFFILTVIIALFLFLSDKNRMIYASFGIAAVSALIRYEGALLLIPLSIVFFVRFRKERSVILKYFFALVIFVLVLLPITYVRTETLGHDGLISQLTAGPRYYQNVSSENGDVQSTMTHFVSLGAMNMVRFLGLASIPTFIVFFPLGIFMMFRKIDYKKLTIILTAIIMLGPAFYAYSRDFQEVRYLFTLFPVFCIFAAFTVKKIREWFKISNIISIIIICIILSGSLIYLQYKLNDYDYEREAVSIALHVYDTTKVSNYYSKIEYLDNARLMDLDKFPILRKQLPVGSKVLYLEGHASLEEFIQYGKTEGLEYLVVDKGSHRTYFLNDVFLHEERYPYLKKTFDSLENSYKKYHVKIFKIDYKMFERMNNTIN